MGEPQRAAESHGKAQRIQERLVRENPDNAEFAGQLGGTLHNIANIDLVQQRFGEAKQKLLGAIVLQKKALAANPRNPTFRHALQGHYTNLQTVARGLGDDALAQEAQRGLDELAASDPQLRVVDAHLASVMKGEAAKDNSDRLALAQRAYDTKRYALAARLWGEALVTDPKLGDGRQAQHRYNAACSAALAGCGKGQGDPPPDDAAKTTLRNEALGWLKAELATWSSALESGPAQARAFVVQVLDHWKQDLDLAGVHDERELAKLTEAERQQWQALWADVDTLRKHAATDPANAAPTETEKRP
jgi:hypothetical protein